jgi:hypothetical protein
MSTAKNKVSSCGIKYHHSTISVSILGIFLTLHTYNYTFIAYIRCELECDQPIMKETLHEKNNKTAIFRLPFEAFPWKSTSNTVSILPINDVTFFWRSASKKENFSSEYQVHSQQYIDFNLRDLSWNPSPAIYVGTLLREQSTFIIVSRLPLERFSWNSTPVSTLSLPTKFLNLFLIGQ